MTTTDVREWARAKGIDIGTHGRIPRHVREQYDSETSADPAGPVIESGYDNGVTVADFPPDPEPEDGPAVVGHPAEVKPKTIRAPRKRRGVFARDKAKPATRKTAAKLPRVSAAGFIEDAYRQVAWAAGGLPPMQRLMYAQSSYAGVVLDEAVKDTFLDRFLQPVVRAEGKAKTAGAILMPPAALMTVLATAPQVQQVDGQWVQDEPSAQHKMALVSLRWSLMLMAEVGSVHLGQVQERIQVTEERGRRADEMMAYILGVELPSEQESTEEEEAVRRAQVMFGADGDNG